MIYRTYRRRFQQEQSGRSGTSGHGDPQFVDESPYRAYPPDPSYLSYPFQGSSAAYGSPLSGAQLVRCSSCGDPTAYLTWVPGNSWHRGSYQCDACLARSGRAQLATMIGCAAVVAVPLVLLVLLMGLAAAGALFAAGR